MILELDWADQHRDHRGSASRQFVFAFFALVADVTLARPRQKIASAIAAMNTAKVPTCSVSVLLKPIRGRSARRGLNATLPAHWNYAGVHADTDDARGIDVVFICDNTLFQVPLPLGTSNVV